MKTNWPTTIITALCLLLSRFGSDLMQVRGQENITSKESVPSYLKGYKKLHADRICDLALAANMRCMTLTTCHLGRLRMYKTKVTDFTSLNSPAKRDLVAELSQACQKRGLGLFPYVPPETARTDDEHIRQNRTTLRELLTQYGPIAGIWFD